MFHSAMRQTLLCTLIACLLITSCEKDESPLPAYIQEMGEIQTNAQGIAETLMLDQGEKLTISNTIGGLEPDTLIRVRALFLRPEKDKVWLSQAVSVLTPHLTRYKPEVIKTDPVTLTACWKGINYINLRLDIKGTAEGKHIFGFHEVQCVRHPDGSQTLEATLLHDQNNDPPYYTRETYLSLPLRPLFGRLNAGKDTLQLNIFTHKGWEKHKMPL